MRRNLFVHPERRVRLLAAVVLAIPIVSLSIAPQLRAQEAVEAGEQQEGDQSRESMALDNTAAQWSLQFAYQANTDYRQDTLASGEVRPEGNKGYFQFRMVAPVLVHTADEAWLALHGLEDGDSRCVHTEALPEAFDLEMGSGWPAVMELRAEVLKSLEGAKEAQGIKNTLDAGIDVNLAAEEAAVIEPFIDELADLFGVSRFALTVGDATTVTVVDLREEPRCERSWKRDGTVKERSDGGMLSDRDAAAVGVS